MQERSNVDKLSFSFFKLCKLFVEKEVVSQDTFVLYVMAYIYPTK